MRVLVTGGAGYVGSHTVDALRRRGDDVLVLDSLGHGHRAALGDVPLVVGDIADEGLVARLLAEHGSQAIVHFAAHKRVDESLEAPGRYFANNVAGSLALLRAAVTAGIGRFVFSSTCAVYGAPARLPVDESAAIAPENPYGASKAMVEQMLGWFERAHGLRSISLRYFNAAGAALDGSNGEDWEGAQNLIPAVLRVAAGRRPEVQVFGIDYDTADGTAVRDYVHVLDLARGHLAALDHLAVGGASATLNLGTGQGASVRQVVAAATRITGRSIAAVDQPRRPGDPPAVWADPSRAAATLGWRAELGLDDILASAWRWHEAHPEGHLGPEWSATLTAPTTASTGVHP
ncbi:MAG TPA: UDP-glucose 4-epimerase GalE [Candidatus Limnocylindrales bacterium]|nr:UDP-glucose 4-epimerase GalE [Candidatus Limnocylindrales bacterium]